MARATTITIDAAEPDEEIAADKACFQIVVVELPQSDGTYRGFFVREPDADADLIPVRPGGSYTFKPTAQRSDVLTGKARSVNYVADEVAGTATSGTDEQRAAYGFAGSGGSITLAKVEA